MLKHLGTINHEALAMDGLAQGMYTSRGHTSSSDTYIWVVYGKACN